MNERVLVIFGPTASGKTELAVQVAKQFGGEVVSCDSQQIYKELFIGTARPTESEMNGVPHHLIGHVSVKDFYNVARFFEEAKESISNVISRGHLPIVCGGSYMWLTMLLDGLSPTPPANPDIRKKLELEAEEKGVPKLHERLSKLDPLSAQKISSNDLKRVVRALEIYELTGKPRSEIFDIREKLQYSFIKIGIVRPRLDLYDRINARVEKMVDMGLLDEVKNLIDSGFVFDIRRIAAHGYPPILDYFEGKKKLNESLDEMKKVTRHYAKRQLTFLRSRLDFVVTTPDLSQVARILEERNGSN